MILKNQYVYKCQVVKVVDGDTVDVLVDLGFSITTKQRIRLYGINTPELNSKDELLRNRASDAAKLIATLCFGVECTIKTYSAKDKWGRYLADLYITEAGNTLSVGQLLVEKSLAEPYMV